MIFDTDDCRMSLEVTKITEEGSSCETESVLLKEHELDIIINEQHAMRLVCTKNDLQELVLGRLLTAGYITGTDDVSKIYFDKHETQASVFLNRQIDLEKARIEEKSCCPGNRVWYLAENDSRLKKLPVPGYRSEWIFNMARTFEKGSVLHDMTSSTHSCMLAEGERILFMCEDIGRHNAVDKVIGHGLAAGIPLAECILYTSGRIPVDMAEKAIAAGIPVLASKSSPTADALELARSFGLVIIGNAYPDSMKVYDPTK